MNEPTLPAACQGCGGPVSKRNTSGFCHRTPECKRKAQAVADARWYAAHPDAAAARWAAYGPGYKARRAELDSARHLSSKRRGPGKSYEEKLAAVQEFKTRPENTERVREYNRRGRQRYMARTDRPCLYPAGCEQHAEAGLKYCRPHHNEEAMRHYRQRASRIKVRLAGAQEWACPWCGQALPLTPAGTHVDHIIPRASGLVIEEEWNLQLLHGRCNQEKSDKITPQAIELAAEHGLTLAA
jgi:5-methylcytosine-specific restriction endonuclease McrA